MMTSTDDLKKAVEQAEAAVATLKDPELRKAAFDKVLEKLLGGGGGGSAPSPKGGRAKGRAQTGQASRSRGGPQSRVEALVEGGFFKKPRTFSTIKAELATAGFHIAKGPLSGTLLRLCQKKVLRRQPSSGNEGYAYSNW